MCLVYVYGTLRKKQGNHHVLGPNASYVGSTFITGYRMVDLGAFPGVFRAGDEKNIYAECYSVDLPALKNLDRLEGHPTFYERTRISTQYGAGWIYILNDRFEKNSTEIEHGDWIKHVTESAA